MTVPQIRIERTIAAAPERVYAAWTDPAILRTWFCPNPDLPLEVTADVVVGGAYRVDMGNGKYVAEGVYTELDPPHVVAFTWRWTSDAGPASHVRVSLTPDGAGTLLVLTHFGLASDDEAAGHREGWELELGRLTELLL